MGLMSYLAAGAVGGLGEGIQKGAQLLATAFTQQMLNDERGQLDKLRDERLYGQQQTLQTEKITAERDLAGIKETADAARHQDLITRQTEVIKLNQEQNKAQAAIAEAREKGETERDKLSAQKQEKLIELQKEQAVAQGAHYHAIEAKDAELIKLQREIANKGTLQVGENRALYLISPKGETTPITVKDEQGQSVPLRSAKGVNEANKLLVDTRLKEMDAIRDRIKLGEPDAAKELKDVVRDIERLLGVQSPSPSMQPVTDPFKPQAPQAPTQKTSQPEAIAPRPQPRPRSLLQVPRYTEDEISRYQR